jgi:hypothetical protein
MLITQIRCAHELAVPISFVAIICKLSRLVSPRPLVRIRERRPAPAHSRGHSGTWPASPSVMHLLRRHSDSRLFSPSVVPPAPRSAPSSSSPRSSRLRRDSASSRSSRAITVACSAVLAAVSCSCESLPLAPPSAADGELWRRRFSSVVRGAAGIPPLGSKGNIRC